MLLGKGGKMPKRDLHVCFRADPELQIERRLKNSVAGPTEADTLRDLVTEKVGHALQNAGAGAFKGHGHGALGFGDGGYTITSIFAVEDFERAEQVARAVIDAPEFSGKVDTFHWFEDSEVVKDASSSEDVIAT